MAELGVQYEVIAPPLLLVKAVKLVSTALQEVITDLQALRGIALEPDDAAEWTRIVVALPQPLRA